MTKDEVRQLQSGLNQSGFAYQTLNEPLKEDGIYGRDTDRVYRAWLDRDVSSVPTVTPEPRKPWWAHKAMLGGLATVIASIAGIWGWGVDSAHLQEALIALATLATGMTTIWGSIREPSAVYPAVIPPASNRGLRHSVQTDSQPDRPTTRDARGHFETE